MSWIQRGWTPEEADNWSREDWIAACLSVLAYLLIAMGAALSLLAMQVGFVLLLGGIASTWLMYYVIDPKLRAISSDYERKQKEYLRRVEKLTRWEKAE